MKTFEVYLSRQFKVTINDKNKNDAKTLSEYFISGGVDLSIDKERNDYGFQTTDIEMVWNKTMESKLNYLVSRNKE